AASGGKGSTNPHPDRTDDRSDGHRGSSAMFLGEFQHSLDAKGRVILPAKFREQLEGGAVMARALDGCLAVYPVEEFQRVASTLQEARVRDANARRAARAYFSGAIEIAPDKQGRVAIPAS